MSEVEEIRAAGWTQGSYVTLEADTLAQFAPDSETNVFVVASHPCDVVAQDFEREPLVELQPVFDRAEANGNLTFGKNPRRLHVIEDANVREIDMVGRVSMPRRLLATIRPMAEMESQNKRLLASWLAARYARAAFADAFNERIRSATKLIAKSLKTGGTNISGLWVATSFDELPDANTYEVVLVGTMRSEDFDDTAKWAEANETFDEVARAFGDAPGINLRAHELKSESDTTLDFLRTFARWDFDSLTFREGGELGTLPATQ